MEFEWDEAKSRRNVSLGRVSFEDAALVFLDPDRTTLRDERADYGEARSTPSGGSRGGSFVVTYTLRGAVVRIIHARKANTREERRHAAHTKAP